MKVNIVLTLISLIGAALLAYMFYAMADQESKLLNALAISGFVSVVSCLECGLGISWGSPHRQANAFAVSLVFFFIFIAEHCCFAIWGNEIPWLVIATGLILLMYILIIYGITKAKM